MPVINEEFRRFLSYYGEVAESETDYEEGDIFVFIPAATPKLFENSVGKKFLIVIEEIDE